jgi:hypothetical protein
MHRLIGLFMVYRIEPASTALQLRVQLLALCNIPLAILATIRRTFRVVSLPIVEVTYSTELLSCGQRSEHTRFEFAYFEYSLNARNFSVKVKVDTPSTLPPRCREMTASSFVQLSCRSRRVVAAKQCHKRCYVIRLHGLHFSFGTNCSRHVRPR